MGFVLCAIPLYWHLEGTWKYSHESIAPKNIRLSLEYGHLLVHDMGRAWMPHAMRQLNRMEQKYDQQGSCLL
jgi:RNase P/RNase MRP subunit p30